LPIAEWRGVECQRDGREGNENDCTTPDISSKNRIENLLKKEERKALLSISNRRGNALGSFFPREPTSAAWGGGKLD